MLGYSVVRVSLTSRPPGAGDLQAIICEAKLPHPITVAAMAVPIGFSFFTIAREYGGALYMDVKSCLVVYAEGMTAAEQ